MRVRQNIRVRSSIPAAVTLLYGAGQVAHYDGEVVDISVAGMCVVMMENSFGLLASGAKARVLQDRAHARDPLQLMATVVNTATGRDNRFRIHFRFDRPCYDAVASLGRIQRISIDLNPYGWADSRSFSQALKS